MLRVRVPSPALRNRASSDGPGASPEYGDRAVPAHQRAAMATTAVHTSPLFLQPIAGPPLPMLRLDAAAGSGGNGSSAGAPTPGGGRTVTIGRAADCDARLENPVISKHHASIAR